MKSLRGYLSLKNKVQDWNTGISFGANKVFPAL
jgi:hypothetical protein